jgi:hypothetical protein
MKWLKKLFSYVYPESQYDSLDTSNNSADYMIWQLSRKTLRPREGNQVVLMVLNALDNRVKALEVERKIKPDTEMLCTHCKESWSNSSFSWDDFVPLCRKCYIKKSSLSGKMPQV